MATLSLCMIVKDEAEKLPRALASVQDLCDEIIVIDTGSRDRTPTVAEQAGAKVDFLLWGDDFAQARNASLDRASSDWLLVLDADETLTSAGRQLIGAIKQGKPLGSVPTDQLLLVTLLRREIGANQSPYTQVSRLFRNLPEIKFVRPYHESVDDSVEVLMASQHHWQIAHFDPVAIDHTGYQVDEITAKGKYQRAQRIMEAHLAEHPHDSYMANKLGALYTQSSQRDPAPTTAAADQPAQKALKTLQTALRSGNFDPLTEYELHYHLGIAHRQLGQLEAAEAAYRQAIALPIPPKLKLGAYLNLAALLKQQGDLDGSVAQYEAAARIDPSQPMTYFNLGVVHRAKGYLEPALRAYEYALVLDPNYAAAHQNLAVVLFKLGRLPESKRAFDRAIALSQKTNPAEAERIQQGMKALGFEKILG